MERTAHGQTQGAARAGLLGLDAGGLHGLHGARDHQLARAVVVGRDDHAVDRGADLLDLAVLQTEHGCHRARLLLAGGLHGHGALRDELQTVLEREGARDDERRELAQRVTGDCIGLDTQRLGHDDRVEEDGRLRHAGLLELLVGTGEHDVGDAEAEDLVGLLEKGLRLGNVVVEVFAHADGLSSLTGEYVCVFHRFRVLAFSGDKDTKSRAQKQTARFVSAEREYLGRSQRYV